MQSPNSSIAFSIGSFDVHYYGIVMFFAILAGIFVIYRMVKQYYKDISTDIILDMLPVIILSSILGARIYYVLMDFQYYMYRPQEIFAVWMGGLSIHGALIGGITAGVILAKKNNISFFKYADVFAFGLLIGQAIGRFGNYFNCEAFGIPTSLPWGLYIPALYRPEQFLHYEYFHPTFLYEAMWNIVVFCILFFIVRKIRAASSGTVFFSYILLYSIGRFFIEYLRVDSVLDISGIPVAQLVSLGAIFFSIMGLVLINKSRCDRNNGM